MSVAAGMGPALQCHRVRAVKQPVNKGWHRHAARCRESRQDPLRRLGEFAFQKFSFQFQADQKKENGHQAVIDPEQQRFGNLKSSSPHLDRDAKKQVVNGCRRRIGERERQQGGNQQKDAAGSFEAEEFVDGFGQRFHRVAVVPAVP